MKHLTIFAAWLKNMGALLFIGGSSSILRPLVINLLVGRAGIEPATTGLKVR